MDKGSLFRVLDKHLSSVEITTICFELSLQKENFSAKKSLRIQEIITYLEQRGRLEELYRWVEANRPDIELNRQTSPPSTLPVKQPTSPNSHKKEDKSSGTPPLSPKGKKEDHPALTTEEDERNSRFWANAPLWIQALTGAGILALAILAFFGIKEVTDISPSPTPTATETLIAVAVDTATATTSPTETKSPTPLPTETIAPSSTPTILPTATETPTPSYTPEPTHTATATHTPSPTHTTIPTSTPSATPTATQSEDKDTPLVRILNGPKLYVYPRIVASEILMNVPLDEIATLLAKDADREFDWVFVELDSGARGWIQESNMQAHNSFLWNDIETETFPYSNGNPPPTSTPNSTRESGRNSTTPEATKSCALATYADFSNEAGDHFIRWNNIPAGASHLYIEVLRIDPAPGDLTPLVTSQEIDNDAMGKMKFNLPPTSLIDRGYEKGNRFEITLTAHDTTNKRICVATNTFFWNGRTE